jgi:ribosomal protein L37E
VTPPRPSRQPQTPTRRETRKALRTIYFRCRMCGSVALVCEDHEPVIRCTACGFTEAAAAQRDA